MLGRIVKGDPVTPWPAEVGEPPDSSSLRIKTTLGHERCLIMRARYLTIGLVIVALTAFACTASAATLYDDFDQASLDLTTWYVPAGGFTEPPLADSKVQLTHPDGMDSFQGVLPGDTWYFKIGDAPTGVGLFGTPHINIRNDLAGKNYWALTVWDTVSGGPYYYGPDMGDLNPGDVVKVAWNADNSVDLFKNDVQYGHADVAIDPGQYLTAGPGAGGFLSFDVISLNVAPPPVPEPSTIVLLGMGLFGLLAYAWRKRR